MVGCQSDSIIETKLQVIELSLPPPNSQGLMPAGVQRFPFEFPIPTSLPMTTCIKNRLEIFYQLTASLCPSTKDTLSFGSWIDRVHKKKYVAQTPIRIVGSVESITRGAPGSNRAAQETSLIPDSSSSTTSLISDNCEANFDRNTFDEQHDLLALLLSGRFLGNFTHSNKDLAAFEGIRYKIGIDRTAIALGTSIGVDVMIQPTLKEATVKNILLKVIEKRNYSVKVPAGHWGTDVAETKYYNEKRIVILKWAYGYSNNKQERLEGSKKGSRFLHQNKSIGEHISSFDLSNLDKSICLVDESLRKIESENSNLTEDYESELTLIDTPETPSDCELINLKELDQHIPLGEYFSGSFVMPVPDCSYTLRPSMTYESIKIKHWLELVVTVECNNKTFDLNLESPGYVLDCRLVNNDEPQTLIPSPPAYDPNDMYKYGSNWRPSSFWEQREPITLESGWGSRVPCPCEAKKVKSCKEDKIGNSQSKCDDPSASSNWGPPPSYSNY